MDQAYLINRDKSFINRYKLKRRAEEIYKALSIFTGDRAFSLLDVGSADGSLLHFFNERLNIDKAIGIETSLDCVRRRVSEELKLIVAEGETMPFLDNSFDVIIAASVIDHLKDVGRFLNESRRVLRRNGLLAITAIIPFYDKMANRFGIDNGLHPHIKTFSLLQIKETLKKYDFRIALAKRFALPSFGLIPFEGRIESILNKMRINQLMFYSLVIGQK